MRTRRSRTDRAGGRGRACYPNGIATHKNSRIRIRGVGGDDEGRRRRRERIRRACVQTRTLAHTSPRFQLRSAHGFPTANLFGDHSPAQCAQVSYILRRLQDLRLQDVNKAESNGRAPTGFGWHGSTLTGTLPAYLWGGVRPVVYHQPHCTPRARNTTAKQLIILDYNVRSHSR